MDYSNIPLGFKITTQMPLDSKTIVNSESILSDLGFNNNLAFTYYDGLRVLCQQEKTEWIWREVVGAEIGFLATNFTYPANIIVNEITYSGKQYNFFKTNKDTIKSNESISLAKRKGDVLYDILDQYTGEEITLSKTTGTPTVDNIIYFQSGTEYFKRNFTKLNPYMFGAKADGINNDTSALQAAINFSSANNVILELKGNFLSNTLTISDDIELETVCKIQSIIDNDILIIDGAKVNHTGSLTLRGFTRNTLNRGIILKNGVLNSTFDKVYISNTGLGIDYEASGNNNIVAWNLLDIRLTSSSASTTFTKGAFVSNTTLYNIGEITTILPISVNMGTIIINGEVYPIVAKPFTVNTYYVGNFYNLPSTGTLYHYVGGGIIHRKHSDNGAVEYKTLRLASIAGSSITVQSLYGVTVNGGEIEGCGTNVVVGGIFMNGANPETIYSIRSLFEGLHTEANDANKPFIYTLKNSMVTFKGCVMGNGIVVGAPETGTNFQSGYGTDRTSNYYYGRPNEDFPTIRPNDPTFKVYKDLTTGSVVYLELRDLIPMMSYAGDLRVNYVCQGEYNMLNIPVGQTRTLRVTPLGWNTLNGGTAYEDIVVTGIAGIKEYKITFLLVDKNFTYYINKDQADFALNDDVVHITGDTMTGALAATGLTSQGNVIAAESLFGKYTQLTDPTSSNFINSGSDTEGSFFNSNASYRFQTQAGANLLNINKDTGNINVIGDFITGLDLRARYSRLTDIATGNFLNSGADATGGFINSSTNTRFLTNNSYIPLTLSGQTLIIGYQPTTSAGTYDILTRNTSTGIVEKVPSTVLSTPVNTAFINKTYAATMTVVHDSDNPNFEIDITGNLDLTVTGTVNGDSGLVNLYFSATEVATINGTKSLSLTGTGVMIPIYFIHDTDGIKWYDGRESSGASVDTSLFALADGTTLWHTAVATNVGTFSNVGTACTGIGTTITTNMVGAKVIKANGEIGIITARASDTSFTATGFSTNSVGTAFEIKCVAYKIKTDGSSSSFDYLGNVRYNMEANGNIDINGNGFRPNQNIVVNGSQLDVQGTVILSSSGYVKAPFLQNRVIYTVATLPAQSEVGIYASVSDALAPTWHSIAVGGGAITTPVYWDGTNWIVV